MMLLTQRGGKWRRVAYSFDLSHRHGLPPHVKRSRGLPRVCGDLAAPLTPHNTPPYARLGILASTALSTDYRGGRWFESTPAYHGSSHQLRIRCGRRLAQQRVIFCPPVLPTAADFDPVFATTATSTTFHRLAREASADDFPEGADPFSFTTRSELDLIAGLLEIDRGQTLVDIACGQGGPGLWVARSAGAQLIGVDFSAVGVAQAESRATAMGLASHARFLLADAAATGLPGGHADAAMSIDALQFMPDKAAVLAEVRRILRPNACFALTTWEPAENEPPATETANNRPLRTLLEGAGFSVERYQATPAWRRIARVLYEGWLREKETLVAEMGPESYAELEEEATELLPKLDDRERVLILSRAT